MSNQFPFSCPVPTGNYVTVQLAHGGGGRLMRNLIEDLFRPAFGSGRSFLPPAACPQPPHDSCRGADRAGRLAFTTDSYVVSPLFFPGGDIGKLAVCGTVNDLAMAGADRSI